MYYLLKINEEFFICMEDELKERLSNDHGGSLLKSSLDKAYLETYLKEYLEKKSESLAKTKSRLIREFIDKNIEKNYTITICFKKVLNETDFLDVDRTEVIGSNPNEIIGSNGFKIIVFDFKDLFNWTYGPDATLFVSFFVDEPYNNSFTRVFESMNLNTLEVKEIDFEIY